MNLLIRADASPAIGSGHIMRCLALAQNWRDRIGEVIFATINPPAALQHRLLKEGMKVHKLIAYPGKKKDIKASSLIIEKLKPMWVVVDGYQFSADYLKSIKNDYFKLLLVDDVGVEGPVISDLLLNQNVYANRSLYDCPSSNTEFLLGCNYVLLRREFLKWKNLKKPSNHNIHKILVTMGGSDFHNVTMKVIDALESIVTKNIEICIVTSSLNPYTDQIKERANSSAINYQIIVDPNDIARYMISADFAISAAGSTCWELSYIGIPFATVILAENQEKIACGLEAHSISMNLGWHQSLTKKSLINCLSSLINEPKIRTKMSRNGKLLVDGNGARRVVDYMITKAKYRKRDTGREI